MNSNTTPPADIAEARARSLQHAKRKKIVKVILIVFAVIIGLYLLMTALNPEEWVKRWFSKDGEGDTIRPNIEFYEADWDYNIMTDEEYLEQDRRVSFYDPDSGATYWVEEDEVSASEEYVQFFHSYFQTLIYGDALNYAEHFSSGYEGELPEKFTERWKGRPRSRYPGVPTCHAREKGCTGSNRPAHPKREGDHGRHDDPKNLSLH